MYAIDLLVVWEEELVLDRQFTATHKILDKLRISVHLHQMLGRNTIFLALILLLQIIEARKDESYETSCSLASESPSPEMTPWSS